MQIKDWLDQWGIGPGGNRLARSRDIVATGGREAVAGLCAGVGAGERNKDFFVCGGNEMSHTENGKCTGENRSKFNPVQELRSKHPGLFWTFPVAGFLALVWFLIRVIPKPARAAYPCQRVAGPLAGSFLLWIPGALASLAIFHRMRLMILRSRRNLVLSGLLLILALGIAAIGTAPDRAALADNPVPNAPVGAGKGIYPGRVGWVHDPAVTDWAGPGQGHWWEGSHTKQDVADRMMSSAVRSLTGKNRDTQAWDALFRHFNQTRGQGNAGYKPGEKITIKVNLVGCIVTAAGAVDPVSYDMVRTLDYMNTSPQMMVALLRQLVHAAGVRQSDISIGDPLTLFPNQYYEICHREFPEVHYLDHNGGSVGHPRTKVEPSAVPFYWSSRPAGKSQDYFPTAYVEARYFINMANLKSHTLAGVTLCAKNHLGSLIRTPPASGYYNIHDSWTRNVPGYGHYRALVDLMGHAQTGGKGLVYFIDGLYAGVHPIETSPKRWKKAPFNDNWSSSLFVSQDPVAIDSVAFDFLYEEWSDYPHMSGADDYLHEAALADNPPSGTFYDPDHATAAARLGSLGAHEHWNNAERRQYSRNLGQGKGIELIKSETASISTKEKAYAK